MGYNFCFGSRVPKLFGIETREDVIIQASFVVAENLQALVIAA